MIGSRGSRNRAVVGRNAVWGAVVAVLTINALAGRVISFAGDNGLLSTVIGLGGVSALVWFALFVIDRLSFAPATADLSSRDWLIAAGCAILALVPSSPAAGLGVFLAGAYLLATSAAHTSERRLSYLALALSGVFLWGKLALNFLAVWVLPIDAFLASAIAGADFSGNVVYSGDQNARFVVSQGCSSLVNISFAILAWVSITQAFDVTLERRDLPFGFAVIVAVVSVNLARLAVMFAWPETFDYVHEGPGRAYFAFGSAAAAVVASLIGVQVIAKRRAEA